MLDTQTIETFLSQNFTGYAPNSLASVKSILSHFQAYEVAAQKDLCSLTRADTISLYQYLSRSVLGSGYTKIRSVLLTYLLWQFHTNGTEVDIAAVRSVSYKDCGLPESVYDKYFPSEQAFLSALNSAMPGDAFVREKTLCVLYWLGFNREEAVSLQSSDLNDSIHQIGRVQQVSPPLYSLVKHCSQLLSYPREKRDYEFIPSPYILKRSPSLRSADDDIDLAHRAAAPLKTTTTNKLMAAVNQQMSLLPKDNDHSGKNIRAKMLFANGLFCRVYELEQQGACAQKPAGKGRSQQSVRIFSLLNDRDQMNLPLSTIRTKLAPQYATWKQAFYPQ